MKHRLVALLLALSTLPSVAVAEDREAPVTDVLNIDATVSSDVAPDLAVIALAVVREGTDVAALTRDVNATLARAFAEAKKTPAVVAASGAYSTVPRYDDRPANSAVRARTGWQVTGEIVLRSKDFTALGTLVGNLAQTLQITRSGFEISPDLRAQASAALLERGARAFQDKAAAAARAFGYAGYAIRQVTVGDAQEGGGTRPRLFAMAKTAEPMPIESGEVTLTLTINGSLQLKK